jgi:peptidoglycan L-alanyl-D-glutamate endopeptidase CwlK
MPKFSVISKERLDTCHPDLIMLMNEVIKHTDISILCGHRGEEEQNKAFNEGKSKVRFPFSKHNKTPSLAVDIAPYNNGINWNDIQRFKDLAEIVKECAEKLDISVEWGGDWVKFKDYPHWQLKI